MGSGWLGERGHTVRPGRGVRLGLGRGGRDDGGERFGGLGMGEGGVRLGWRGRGRMRVVPEAQDERMQASEWKEQGEPGGGHCGDGLQGLLG